MKVTLRALTPTSSLSPPPPALSLLGRFCVAELLIFIRVSNYIGSPATVSVQLLRMLCACSFNGADSYDFVSSPLKAAPCTPVFWPPDGPMLRLPSWPFLI